MINLCNQVTHNCGNCLCVCLCLAELTFFFWYSVTLYLVIGLEGYCCVRNPHLSLLCGCLLMELYHKLPRFSVFNIRQLQLACLAYFSVEDYAAFRLFLAILKLLEGGGQQFWDPVCLIFWVCCLAVGPGALEEFINKGRWDWLDCCKLNIK